MTTVTGNTEDDIVVVGRGTRSQSAILSIVRSAPQTGLGQPEQSVSTKGTWQVR